jgi:hypothetical protein
MSFTPRKSSITHPITFPGFTISNRLVCWICSHIGLTALYLDLFFTLSGQGFKQFLGFLTDFSVYNRKSPTFSWWPFNSYGFDLFSIPTKSIQTARCSVLLQPFSSDPKHFPSPPPSYSEHDPPSPHASASASRRALTRIISLTWEVARHYNEAVDRRKSTISLPRAAVKPHPIVGFCRYD